jgi:hypothetical protein
MVIDYISRASGLDCLTIIPLAQAQENDEFLADVFGLVPFGGAGGFRKSVVDIVGDGTYDGCAVIRRSRKDSIRCVPIWRAIPECT